MADPGRANGSPSSTGAMALDPAGTDVCLSMQVIVESYMHVGGRGGLGVDGNFQIRNWQWKLQPVGKHVVGMEQSWR